MGLFSRKSKQQQQPAAEQPPGSPLSPPETRYANARPPTPQHLQSHYQQQYQQQRASSDRLPPPPPQQQEQQQHQRAGPSRSESPLPPAPRQQPRASGSYIRPPPREYDHGRPTSDLSGDEDELDAGGGRAYAGQSAMRPPAAVGSSSSSSSSYRWQPPSPPALEREPSDPAKWQLPALGLSPPTSLSLLAPLGLGLRTDNGAASASNSRSSSPPTAPLPSPRNTGGSELGHGYPSSPATADVRSRSSFLSTSSAIAASSALMSSSHVLQPPKPVSDHSFLDQSSSPDDALDHLPRQRPSSDALRQSSYELPPLSQTSGLVERYGDYEDELPLARPPPLSETATSSGPPLPASTSSGGKPPRRRFLGMFSSGGSGGESPLLPGSKGKGPSDAIDHSYGLAYESIPRSHGPPTTTGSTVSEASHPAGESVTAPIAGRSSATRPSAARRISSSREHASHHHPKSPTSPSFSIEAELAQQQSTTVEPSTQPTPRNPRPSPGQRSSSFFANALRVSIPSSSKFGTSPGADGRPPSPAESFRVISARRITTPDESLLLGAAIPVSASPLSTSGSGGWLGARSRPGMGERKRSQSYEWTRASEPLSPTGRTGGVEELQSPEKPEKDVDREAELRSRRVSVAAFRRRRSSAGFDGAASSDVLVIGRDEIQRQAAEIEVTSSTQVGSAVDDSSSDDDDKPLGMLRASGGRNTPTPGAGPAGVSPLAPPASSRPLPRAGSDVNLSSVDWSDGAKHRSAAGSQPSSGFSVPSRPPHHRGVSLTLPSPNSTTPARDLGRSVTPTPADPTTSPASATTPTATSASMTAASSLRTGPPWSSSMLSLSQQQQQQSQAQVGRRDNARPHPNVENPDDESVAQSQPHAGSQSMPASPKKRPVSAISRSPGPSVVGLPVGSRPIQSGGPVTRPTSRYEQAKAEAALRKAAAHKAEAAAAESKSPSPPLQRLSSSSSSDSEEELHRPASRASTAMQSNTLTGLAISCKNASNANAQGKSPREPLLSLPKELEKPVLDRQRSIRRASVGDADQILSDVAAAKVRLAAVAAIAVASRPQPTAHRPLTSSSLATEHLGGGRPVARRRGSESVLNRMEKERLATHAEDSDTSDGYGQDDLSSTPRGSASLATNLRPSFLKHKESSSTPLAIPPVSEPTTIPAALSSRRQQLDDADESDSDDQPLGQLVQPSAVAGAQTPARAQQHKALSSASNPMLRVTAASPQAVPAFSSKAGKSQLSSSNAPTRSASNNSLSSLASSSSSSAAPSVSVKAPPPKSILRRTSFANEPSNTARPDRNSLFSTSPSSARIPLQPPSQQHPPPRPSMSQATRSVSANSIPSPTTSTQFPPRPAFHAQSRSSGSPSSSSASGRTTGESSSSIMPLTPRESSELGRQGLRQTKPGGKDVSQLGPVHAADDEQPDEAELERKRNERRRNEALKAVKLGKYANGSAPHPDHSDEDEEDEESAEAPATQFMPFPHLGQQPQPFLHNPYANPFAAGGGIQGFPQFSPGGGSMPLPSFMDPNAMFLFQMQLQAQQAQMAMQMQMAQMGVGGDPSMQYQAMMMAKAQFQQQMAAQAAQLAGDEWERSSAIGGGGGAMSEAGFPATSMGGGLGGLGMGLPGGFNPAMNRFPSAGSTYGGGPTYAVSAYGGGGGPDTSSWNPQRAQAGNVYPSSRSEYGGGGASGSSSRPRRDRFSTTDAPLPSRESFYGSGGHQSRSSINLGGGGPAEHDYYQQSRISPQGGLQAPAYARQRQASGPVSAGHRASFAGGGLAGSKPLVSFSTSPPKTARTETGPDRKPGGRTRTSSSSNLTPLLPPSAPFAREARPASPRSTSPAPPSSWKGSY